MSSLQRDSSTFRRKSSIHDVRPRRYFRMVSAFLQLCSDQPKFFGNLDTSHLMNSVGSSNVELWLISYATRRCLTYSNPDMSCMMFMTLIL
jgi:hypothetical protein